MQWSYIEIWVLKTAGHIVLKLVQISRPYFPCCPNLSKALPQIEVLTTQSASQKRIIEENNVQAKRVRKQDPLQNRPKGKDHGHKAQQQPIIHTALKQLIKINSEPTNDCPCQWWRIFVMPWIKLQHYMAKTNYLWTPTHQALPNMVRDKIRQASEILLVHINQRLLDTHCYSLICRVVAYLLVSYLGSGNGQ